MFLGRLVITVALIAVVAIRFDLDAIKNQLLSIGAATVLATGFLLLIQLLFLTFRWQWILDASGIAMLFRSVLRIVLIGMFFNQCLPTSLGGDGVRAFMLRSDGVPLERAVNSVLVDRLSGLAGLLPFLLLGAPFLLAWTRDLVLLLAYLAITALFSAALAGYFLGDRLIARIRPLAEFAPLRVVAAASAYAREIAWHSPRALGLVGLAIAVHLLNVVLVMILAEALRAPIAPGAALVLVPPIFATAMLPISYGGWGARELAMIVSLALAGVPTATALTISVTIGFLGLISTLPGALLWLRAEPWQRFRQSPRVP
jgi:uncharacterized membrane protein YbhN (UPF0104 family)